MKVLIVDDHALFRVGLEMLLSQLISPLQTSLAANADQALQMIAASNRFDLVLLDWNMPNMPGINALLAIREALPDGRVVILSGEQNQQLVRTCIDHGAAGFIPKDTPPDQLTAALTVIANGGIFLPSLLQLSIEAQSHSPAQGTIPSVSISEYLPELTARQADVLKQMAHGLPNKLIARALGISEETVKQHLSAIYQLLEVRNRTEAVYVISKRGLRIP